MDGRRGRSAVSGGQIGSPGTRGVRRNRSTEWRHRHCDSSSDNDEIVRDMSGGIALRPAKSGEMLSGGDRERGGVFSSQHGGFHHQQASYPPEVGHQQASYPPDMGHQQLHYASQSVTSAGPTYQSLSRRPRNKHGHKHSSLSSSDNNSDTTTYADSDVRCKLEAFQNGLHTPPEPAPPEAPSKGALHAARSLQRIQGHQYSSGVGTDPSSITSPSVAEYRLPSGARGQMDASTLRGFNSPSDVANMAGPGSRLVLDFGDGRKDSGGGVCGVLGGDGGAVRPLVMPVYPTRTANLCHHPAPPPAYSPQLPGLKEECQYRCSWRLAALLLASISTILLALVIYFAATGGDVSDRSRCVFIEDALAMVPDNNKSNKPSPKPDYGPAGARDEPKPPRNRSPPPTTFAPPVVARATPAPPPPAPGYLSWEQPVTYTIPPGGVWRLERRMSQPQTINVTLSTAWSARLAVLGCRDSAPSITRHEFSAYLRSGRIESHPQGMSTRPQRHLSAQTVNASMSEFLEAGLWLIGVYNDGREAAAVTLHARPGLAGVPACPGDCSGHGTCHRGHCVCDPAYTGPDCSNSVCPVLCSNHGRYGGGLCHCQDGWKGVQCDIPATDCVISDCHGHGVCRVGQCVCSQGWTGEFCQKADCADPSCSGHGLCVEGVCICHAGWLGASCASADSRIHRCLPDCSGHGTFDLTREKCDCDPAWTGQLCSKPRCELDCGLHGSCEDGGCSCEPGWTGRLCQLRSCDVRCQLHGQCQDGTCVCMTGWNGKHCTIEGCIDECTGRGTCTLGDDGWYGCVCNKGWAGANCSIPVELNCQDGIDNDGDGMTDCSDSECCWGDASCRGSSLMCLYSPEPVDVLLRKRPARQTASFYQRVKFLIEESSVQDYAEKGEYWERRVSVIRGRLVTSRGLGIVGVRVSVNRDTRFGLTLSRKDGWFDIMVNGGGAISLQFQRSPFRPMIQAVSVSWNQMVVLEPIVMLLEGEQQPLQHRQGPGLYLQTASCPAHRPEQLQLAVVNSWLPDVDSACCRNSAVVAETQVLQESVEVPGTGLQLVYSSQDAAGYHSTLLVRMTSDPVPDSLGLVHLMVVVEGTVFRRTFEADPNITYTYSWNKRNVYEQKVYGVVEARVSVGYEYRDCENTLWNTRVTSIAGFRMDISSIGGWNLDVHHMYNFHEGILQKGDGGSVHFKQEARVAATLLGTGQQRSLHCDRVSCSGQANSSRLLTPVALAAAADGSVYVGDFNLVRRVTPQGTVYTVVELSSTQVSYKYHIAVSPVEQLLYISDPEAHQLFRVLTTDQVSDPSKNLERIAGTGDRCVPGDVGKCGDGLPAIDAKLAHPKGLAVSPDLEVFFADGTNIRFIDTNGIIRTLVGHHEHAASWKPLPCFGSLSFAEVQPQWPTSVALSPVDGSLHYVDDRMVLRLSPDGKVQVRVGRPAHCPALTPQDGGDPIDPTADPLQPRAALTDLVIDSSGRLYVAETDSDGVNYIQMLDGAGRMRRLAGAPAACSCQKDKCSCRSSSSGSPPLSSSSSSAGGQDPSAEERRLQLATQVHLTGISAITVTPDGAVHLADPGALKIYSLRYNLPDEGPGFKVIDPVADQVYGFNRYGQHVETKDLLTGRSIYLFQYSKNTGFGRLSRITDWSGNTIQLVRDYSNVVSSIENAQGERFSLHHLARDGLVTNFSTPANKYHFQYDPDTELLRYRTDSRGHAAIYIYDVSGRLQQAVTSTGETLKLEYRLGHPQSLHVTVQSGSQAPLIIEIDQSKLSASYIYGGTSSVIRTLSNSTILLRQPWRTDTLVEFSTVQQMALLYPQPAQVLNSGISQRQIIHADGNFDRLENQLQWNLSPLQGNQMQGFLVTKALQSNGSDVMTLDYDPVTLRQRIYTRSERSGGTADSKHQRLVLTVQYKESVAPAAWTPEGLQAMTVEYDSIGRVESRSWGSVRQLFSYGRSGVTRRQRGDKAIGASVAEFTYDPNHQPATFTLPSRRQYEYHYDSGGGLQFVVTPSRSRHFFNLQASLGHLRLQYAPPGGGRGQQTRPWQWHYSQDGRMLLESRPGSTGRTVYRYDGIKRLTEEVQGDGRTLYTYSASTGQLVQVTREEEPAGFSFSSQFVYQGTAVRQWRLTFAAETGLSAALFHYRYDSHQRLTRVDGRIGGRKIQPYAMSYSESTGRLRLLGPFRVSHGGHNETVLYDGASRLVRYRDQYLRHAGVTLSVNGYQLYRTAVKRDGLGRMASVSTWKPDGRRTDRNFTYGPDGQLVTDAGQAVWRYQYDQNGNMIQISVKQSNISLQVDSQDRLVRLGSGVLRYDSSGAMVENFRGDKYMYNGRGLLTAAAKKGRFEVRYFYDEQRRLVARKDQLGNTTQYLYGDPRFPDRVSHVYSVNTDHLLWLLYDETGRPVRLESDDQVYTVISDQCGSPVLLYTRDGRLARHISRTAYGHRYSDTWPQMALPVDYCGGIYDPATELVMLSRGRVYDPLLGQLVSPDLQAFMRNLMTPGRLHLYRLNGNNPLQAQETEDLPKDESDWLRRLGYDLPSLAPQLYQAVSVLTPGSQQRHDPAPRTSPLTPVSGLACRLRRLMFSARRLSLISRVPEMTLRRRPPPERWPRRVSSLASPLGAGAVLQVEEDGRVLVWGLSSVDPIASDVLTSVFNHSFLINITGSHHGGADSSLDVFYFCKPELWRFADDHEQLTRLSRLNVSNHNPPASGSDKGDDDGTSRRSADLRIHTGTAIVHIRYGIQPAQEFRRLARHGRRTAARAAWAHERHLLHTGLASHRWSPAQRKSILSRQKVSSVDLQHRYPPHIYPELSDDPFNIRFGRLNR